MCHPSPKKKKKKKECESCEDAAAIGRQVGSCAWQVGVKYLMIAKAQTSRIRRMWGFFSTASVAIR